MILLAYCLWRKVCQLGNEVIEWSRDGVTTHVDVHVRERPTSFIRWQRAYVQITVWAVGGRATLWLCVTVLFIDFDWESLRFNPADRYCCKQSVWETHRFALRSKNKFDIDRFTCNTTVIILYGVQNNIYFKCLRARQQRF